MNPETYKEIQSLERRLESLPPRDEAGWSKLLQELRLARHEAEDPERSALILPPEVLAAKLREKDRLAAERDELQRSGERLRAILDHHDVDLDRLRALEEEGEELRQRASYLEGRERIGRTALDFLVQARRDTLNPARAVLRDRAHALWTAVTDREDRGLELEEDLTPQVFFSEIGRWEKPDLLSTGTQDQLFLSLRLVLTDILAQGRKPPVFLDEPMAAFDPERGGRFQAWLREASRERQIFLFTCRDDYDKLGDQVIVLPPTASASGDRRRNGSSETE